MTLFIYSTWWIVLSASLVFALVLFIPAYLVHEEDPQGYLTWLRTVLAAKKLPTDNDAKRNIRVLRLSD